MNRRSGVLIYNPAAGQSDLTPKLRSIAEGLARDGVDLVPRATLAAGDAARFAKEAVDGGADIVAVCGGDGTVNETAVALGGSASTLAVLPAGTANVLARELQIPRTLNGAARVIAEGVPARLSLGRAGERRFLMMAGFGFDAKILSGYNPILKRYFGRLAYAARCAEELTRFEVPSLRVRAEGREVEGTMVIAANIRLYGGGLAIAPQADPTDDVLDIVVLQGKSLIDYARYSAGFVVGRLQDFSDVVTFRARELRVESDSGEVQGQIDGEPVLVTPIDISLEPGALSVLVPATSRLVRA